MNFWYIIPYYFVGYILATYMMLKYDEGQREKGYYLHQINDECPFMPLLSWIGVFWMLWIIMQKNGKR